MHSHAVYGPSEMRVNECFNPISVRSAGGKVALDMSVFDDTNPSRCVGLWLSLSPQLAPAALGRC